MAKTGSLAPRLRTTANLITIALFFLLRVGEYTPNTSGKKKRTVPLRKKDVKLWRNRRLIPRDAPDHILAEADAVTICLEKSKNGSKKHTLHHTESEDPGLCPVKAMAYLMGTMRGMPEHTPLGTFRDSQGGLSQVSAADIRAAVRIGAEMDGLEAKGFDLGRIGSHSLRAGGATILKAAGHDDLTIMLMGRWSSNTYMTYIRTQIAEVTAGLARDMARRLTFHNVG